MPNQETQDVPVAAVRRSIEDPTTGAMLEVHAIHLYSVDLANGITNATLGGYVSDTALMTGRRPVNHTTVTLQGVPPIGEDPAQWLYTQILSAPLDNPANVLAGATALYRGE